MADQEILPIKILSKILLCDFEAGTLMWRHRPREMFASDHSWKRWNTRYAGDSALNTANGYGYLRGKIFGKDYRANRVVFAMYYKRWPNDQIDHINGNRTDNRIANLRDVSRQENQRNTKRRSDNASGVTGVHWCNRGKKWRAQIKIDGKQKYIGLFANLEKAVAARKSAEIEHGFHENHGRN